MKLHTNDYKNAIAQFGKQIDSIISYKIGDQDIELGAEILNSITPSFKGNILKSTMKQLDIDSNIDIPLNTVINYKFGVLVDGEYEYIDFGDYIVYSSERQEDTYSYKITCYDFMLRSMTEYHSLSTSNFPMTVREYITQLCNDLSLEFKNENEVFANYDKIILEDLYKNLGYTYRDIFDELAQATASTICINKDNKVEIRYINDTNDTIDESYFKDINVNFGEKYGPINSIVLSRAAGSDNVYLQDEQSIEENGLCEIKISDNQIMNFNDRSDYLPDILNKLNGLEYYFNDYTSTGITYYDLCDRYTAHIGDNDYTCIMFNDEVLVTQGLEENVYTEKAEQSETDYTKADKTDRKINQTYLMVDKQNQVIQALAEKTVIVSDTKEGFGFVQLENAAQGTLYELEISGNISLIFPNNSSKYGKSVMISDDLIISEDIIISSGAPYDNSILYPSNDLFLKGTVLKVDDAYYKLDFDFLNYMNANTFDKYVYRNGEQWIERNVGINEQGEMFRLPNTVIEKKGNINIIVESDSTIQLLSFPSARLKVNYLLQNQYTDTFATNVELASKLEITTEKIESDVSAKYTTKDETRLLDSKIEQTATSIRSEVADTYSTKEETSQLNSKIEQTASNITAEVNKKVGNDEVVAKLNVAIQDGQGVINLTGNQVTIDSDNFKLTSNGTITANSGTFGGDINTNKNAIVGDNLFIGTNQSSTVINKKKINFTNDSFIERTTVGDAESLSMQTPYFRVYVPSGTTRTSRFSCGHDSATTITAANDIYLEAPRNIYESVQPIVTSDKRLKTKIKDINVDWINSLKVKQFEYKDISGKENIGLIAQDYINEEFSKYFIDTFEKNGEIYYGIIYGNITNALIKYCQQLNENIKLLQNKIKILEERIDK